MNKEDEKGPRHKGKKNFLEWTVFTISALLVAGIVAYLGYKTYNYRPSPPVIQVEFTPSPTGLSPYRYYLIIHNHGGETAEEVKIELVLKVSDVAIEKAEMNIPFIPTSSAREGWVNFMTDPGKADTVLARVISFKKP